MKKYLNGKIEKEKVLSSTLDLKSIIERYTPVNTGYNPALEEGIKLLKI